MLWDCCPVCPDCNVGVLWPNGWMDQDATWYRGQPWPRPHYARRGSSSPHVKGHSSPRLFGPCLLRPNDWMHQDATWYAGRPWPRRHCVRWRPSSPPKERGTADSHLKISPPTLLWHGRPCQQLLSSYWTKVMKLSVNRSADCIWFDAII